MEQDNNRTVYTREPKAASWFIGVGAAFALLAIGYLVFSANGTTSSTKAAPLPFEILAGSVLVDLQDKSLILKSPTGACFAIEKAQRSLLWYSKEVPCPTTTLPDS